MRLRPTKFYSVHAKRNEQLLKVDLDADTPDEVVYAIQALFADRWEPPKDEKGRYKKGIPYTQVKIVCCNKDTHNTYTLTHGNVYNYSPTQVVERIIKSLTQKQ
jgi:hypothetical protein